MKVSTFNRSIPFEVTAGTNSVKYTIKVFAAVGEVTVTLTDPNDKKVVNVTLGTKTISGGYGPSEGDLSDNLKPKISGTWKFNIKAENIYFPGELIINLKYKRLETLQVVYRMVAAGTRLRLWSASKVIG